MVARRKDWRIHLVFSCLSFPSKVIFPMHTTALACHQQLDTVLNLGKRKRDVHQAQKFGEKEVGE
jgi:hypothetical protein